MREAVDQLRECFSDIPDEELAREIDQARADVRAETNERLARQAMRRTLKSRRTSARATRVKDRTPQPV